MAVHHAFHKFYVSFEKNETWNDGTNIIVDSTSSCDSRLRYVVLSDKNTRHASLLLFLFSASLMHSLIFPPAWHFFVLSSNSIMGVVNLFVIFLLHLSCKLISYGRKCISKHNNSNDFMQKTKFGSFLDTIHTKSPLTVQCKCCYSIYFVYQKIYCKSLHIDTTEKALCTCRWFAVSSPLRGLTSM